jgi:Matrixin
MRANVSFVARVVLAISLALSGCLFDSRYLQQKSAQKNVAQQQTPRALQSTPAGGADASPPGHDRAKTLRLRVLATPSYAAEVVDWPRQFARLLEDTNRILEPTLEARLELASAATWSTALPSDDLDPLLTELQARDRGDDVDCVVGLVGSLPVFARSFHQLGYGQIMGKHLVLRAMNDALEREAIEVELSRLAAEEREALYQTRKRHKATAAFLHEIGHNLGLIHETDSSSIMSTRYDKSMVAFSPASANIMRLTLEHRSQGKDADERAFARRLLEEFELTRTSWVAAEREAMIASLKMLIARAPAASNDAADAGAQADALDDVAPADRTIYAQAADDLRQGHPQDAWTHAEPLFTRYPDVYAVQDLRCKLALQLSSVWEVTRKECSKLMDITRGKTSPRRK